MLTGIVFALIGGLGYVLVRVRRQRRNRLATQTH